MAALKTTRFILYNLMGTNHKTGFYIFNVQLRKKKQISQVSITICKKKKRTGGFLLPRRERSYSGSDVRRRQNDKIDESSIS